MLLSASAAMRRTVEFAHLAIGKCIAKTLELPCSPENERKEVGMPRYKMKQRSVRPRNQRLKAFQKTAKFRSFQRIAREEGHVILPSTYLQVGNILRQARRAGTLNSPEQVAKVRIALLAAALATAAEEQSERVTIRHLMQGWLNRLAYSGNCPPHLCLFRSVIEREAEVRASVPLYERLAAEIKE
jgi:hypothetical protein